MVAPWFLSIGKSYALCHMVTFPKTLVDPNPVFKVAAFLKSNIGQRTKIILHKRKSA